MQSRSKVDKQILINHNNRNFNFIPKPDRAVNIFIPSTIDLIRNDNKKILNLNEVLKQSFYNKTGIVLNQLYFKTHNYNELCTSLIYRGIESGRFECNISITETELIEKLVNLIYLSRNEFVDDIHTKKLLDMYEVECSDIISNIISPSFTYTHLTQILKTLLNDNISIRSFDLIIQAVAEANNRGCSFRMITEEVRLMLSKEISNLVKTSTASYITVDPLFDLLLSNAELDQNTVKYDIIEDFYKFIESVLGQINPLELQKLAIVTSKQARQILSDYLKLKNFKINVFSKEELSGLSFKSNFFYTMNYKEESIDFLIKQTT